MGGHNYDRHNTDRSHGKRSPAASAAGPFKSLPLEVLSATIDDLRGLQQVIEDLLKQQEHTARARQELEQTLNHARDSGRQACQDLEALTRRTDG